MLYSSNFDDSAFEGVREFNRLIDDTCAVQQRTQDNFQKFKFVTTNHIDLLEGKQALNFFGMTVKDKLFVPADMMDGDSQLRYAPLTNMNVKNELGQLPLPTMPSRYQLAHGDVDIEDGMRNWTAANKKSCDPHDTQFHDRFFYIFDGNTVPTPNALQSVEIPAFGPRGGQTTRFTSKDKK